MRHRCHARHPPLTRRGCAPPTAPLGAQHAHAGHACERSEAKKSEERAQAAKAAAAKKKKAAMKKKQLATYDDDDDDDDW